MNFVGANSPICEEKEEHNICSLSDELVVHIFTYFTQIELCQQICLVCRSWNTLHASNVLWKPFCNSVWLLTDKEIQLPDTPSTPLSAKQKDLLHIFYNQESTSNKSINSQQQKEMENDDDNDDNNDNDDDGVDDVDDDILIENNDNNDTSTGSSHPKQPKLSKHQKKKIRYGVLLDSDHMYFGWCKNMYKKLYLEWPRYSKVYAKMKGLITKLEQWLISNNTTIVLRKGCKEDDLDGLEEIVIGKIPLDLRCFYRIHNGQVPIDRKNLGDSQNITVEEDIYDNEDSIKKKCYLGLFGGYSFYDYHACAYLLSISSIAETTRRILKDKNIETWMKSCLPIVGSAHLVIFTVQKPFSFDGVEFKTGQIVTRTASNEPFLIANDFTSWLESYVNDLYKGKYCVDSHREIIRYPTLASLGSDVTTNGIRIQANALLIPEYSKLQKPNARYFWSYWIRISMDKSEQSSRTSILESRHWQITDGNNNTDEVRGPGVVGYYPKMKPGAYFEYCSCTHLPTPTGVMRGSFQFKNQYTGDVFDAIIGPFALDSNIHI